MQRCPECDIPLLSDSINIQQGVALCPDCGTLSQLSALVFSDRSVQDIITKPPAGCAVVAQGHGAVVSASLQSTSRFLGAIVFALFWNGIVSIFVLLAAAGVYANLVGPIPDWFPVPGAVDGIPQMNDGPMGPGETLFLCLFLIPFVTIGAAMAGVAIMSLVGRVEVVLDEFDSFVATGVGFVKWKRSFDASQVRQIACGKTSWQTDGEHKQLVELTADRTLRFGSMLPAERMEWLRVVLRVLLLKPRPMTRNPELPVLSWVSGER